MVSSSMSSGGLECLCTVLQYLSSTCLLSLLLSLVQQSSSLAVSSLPTDIRPNIPNWQHGLSLLPRFATIVLSMVQRQHHLWNWRQTQSPTIGLEGALNWQSLKSGWRVWKIWKNPTLRYWTLNSPLTGRCSWVDASQSVQNGCSIMWYIHGLTKQLSQTRLSQHMNQRSGMERIKPKKRFDFLGQWMGLHKNALA